MSFWELLVVIVVGLLIIGPERLPETLRTGALWIGRIKRALNNTRADFEQQLGMDEIRRELHNEQVMASLKSLDLGTDDFNQQIKEVDASLQAEIKRIEDSIDEQVAHDQDPNADAELGLEPENAEHDEAEEDDYNDPLSEANANPDHFRRP
ncbi:Sec-independent protein translocase protein TatB [Agaribacterium sp. ZY112]|uniref:Sec-independent protein translocase protein TatB n=1 Tax=Agaribacterium sp. ZY112 TaxID=3233574 RepID=UPI003526B0F7